MFGSLYEIPDKEKEDERETRLREEGQVSLSYNRGEMVRIIECSVILAQT